MSCCVSQFNEVVSHCIAYADFKDPENATLLMQKERKKHLVKTLTNVYVAVRDYAFPPVKMDSETRAVMSKAIAGLKRPADTSKPPLKGKKLLREISDEIEDIIATKKGVCY